MRITKPMVAMLAALSEGEQSGYDLMKATGLKSGLVYPMLARLAAQGLVASEIRRYPPLLGQEKRCYTLTEPGRRLLANSPFPTSVEQMSPSDDAMVTVSNTDA